MIALPDFSVRRGYLWTPVILVGTGIVYEQLNGAKSGSLLDMTK